MSGSHRPLSSLITNPKIITERLSEDPLRSLFRAIIYEPYQNETLSLRVFDAVSLSLSTYTYLHIKNRKLDVISRSRSSDYSKACADPEGRGQWVGRPTPWEIKK